MLILYTLVSRLKFMYRQSFKTPKSEEPKETKKILVSTLVLS